MEINCRQFHSPSDYRLIMIFDELHKQITGYIKFGVCVYVGIASQSYQVSAEKKYKET